jgi:hypothetical protein
MMVYTGGVSTFAKEKLLEKKMRREGVIVCDWTLGPG